MNVTPLPQAPPEAVFRRVPGEVESFVIASERYEVLVRHAGSAFYAPDFFHVRVTDRDGRLLWSGGDASFLDTLFSANIVSDRYHRLVLTRVGDTARPDSTQVVLVDLKDGSEQALGEQGAPGGAGLFLSFDGAFYGAADGTRCVNLASGEDFRLQDRLAGLGAGVLAWGACRVEGCMLVVTDAPDGNVVLFDLLRGEVKDRGTLQWRSGTRATVGVGRVGPGELPHLSVTHATTTAWGTLAYAGTEHFAVSS